MKPIKHIAVLGSHMSWDGGVDFLCFLVNGIVKNDPTIKISLVLPYDSISIGKNFLLLINKVLHHPKLLLNKRNFVVENKNNSIVSGFNNYGFTYEKVYYNYSEKHLGTILKDINADLIFPSIKSLGTTFPVPFVAYIPDLQHKHFPHFFTPKEIESRDKKYSRMLNECTAIIVNSKAVKNDLSTLYPSNKNNVFNLPFTPPAPSSTWLTKDDSVKEKYNLPKRYFIISNQFWKHKSHLTAFEALSLLLTDDNFKDVQLICTGKLQDDRFPDYINSLLDRIKELKVEDDIKFLGFISKDDQIQIMKNSIGVIQPTLFEGGPGGGVVYNAISMGIPCIISDIPINKEISEENVFFFKTGSSEDLAQKMKDLLEANIHKTSNEELIKRGNDRTRLLGKSLLEIFSQVV